MVLCAVPISHRSPRKTCLVEGLVLSIWSPERAWLQEDKIAVVVATVTDDVRLFEVPAMKVCAMRFTDTARARITKVCASASAFFGS